jgi:hypothetical protein
LHFQDTLGAFEGRRCDFEVDDAKVKIARVFLKVGLKLAKIDFHGEGY